MTIEIKRKEEEVVLELFGRLDATSAPLLERTISENTSDIKILTLDFKGLEYISSAGLRVLLSAQKKLQSTGSMKLINVNESVMEIFSVTGFIEVLTIEK